MSSLIRHLAHSEVFEVPGYPRQLGRLVGLGTEERFDQWLQLRKRRLHARITDSIGEGGGRSQVTNLAQPSGKRPMPQMRDVPVVKRTVVLVGPARIPAMPPIPRFSRISDDRAVHPRRCCRFAHSG